MTKRNTSARDARRAAATLAMAVAAMPHGFLTGEASADALTKLDEMQAEDEQRFLSTLSGEPKRIWQRRIARGLTESELEFIRGRLS